MPLEWTLRDKESPTGILGGMNIVKGSLNNNERGILHWRKFLTGKKEKHIWNIDITSDSLKADKYTDGIEFL